MALNETVKKEIIIEELLLRRGVSNIALLRSLFDDVILDICNFCNLKEEEINLYLVPSIKDMIMYRYNTSGGEGIQSENLTGASITYEQDYPKRIKLQLRKFRRFKRV